MGAAVWSGGRASLAMRRRVDGALTSARGVGNALFLPSGGVGKNPPSEARVMADLLTQAGVAEANILLDEASHDTFSSVRNCVRILRGLPTFGRVVVCTDTYHVRRCRWLFHLYGISSEAGAVENGRAQNRLTRWVYYHLREVFAFPLDTVLALASRVTKRA